MSQPGLFHRGLQSLALARELSPGDKVGTGVLDAFVDQALLCQAIMLVGQGHDGT